MSRDNGNWKDYPNGCLPIHVPTRPLQSPEEFAGRRLDEIVYSAILASGNIPDDLRRKPTEAEIKEIQHQAVRAEAFYQDRPEPSEFAKECAKCEDTPSDVDPLRRRLSSIGDVSISIGDYELNPEHFASEAGITYEATEYFEADPDVMGYLHGAFGVAPTLAGQNYRITLGALDLDFCLNESTDEWSVCVDAITADDFVEGARTLALAVQAAKISARKILTEDLERLA